MSLRKVSRAQKQQEIEDASEGVEAAVEAHVKSFLKSVKDTVVAEVKRGNTESLVAAADPLDTPLTLGELYGEWAEGLEQGRAPSPVLAEIEKVWEFGYLQTADRTILGSSLEGIQDYLGQVSDRLVDGIEPPIFEGAFDRVRVATLEAQTRGWSQSELAERIAEELSWTKDRDYWLEEREFTASKIDSYLDPLGPPGSPAREQARMNDPVVNFWQDEHARATLRLDADESYWATRAHRIARTESTGAYNFGTMNALSDEGVQRKRWLGTLDSRTRPSHQEAHDMVVGITQTFWVGDYAELMFPGDSSGPPEEVINCRCVMIQDPL